MRFRFSNTSIIDIEEIHDYLIENADKAVADRVVDEIKRVVKNVLADNPELGTDSKADIDNLLFFPAGKYPNYQIYYQLQGNVLEVYRVLHGKRNTKNILPSE